MSHNWIKCLVMAGTFVPWPAPAEQTCANGVHVEGIVTDPTGAVVPEAQLQTAGREKATSDATGYYTLPCVPGSSVVIATQARGFATGTTRVRGRVGETLRVNIQLAIASVETDVRVSADAPEIDSGSGAGTTTLNAQAVADFDSPFTSTALAVLQRPHHGQGIWCP